MLKKIFLKINKNNKNEDNKQKKQIAKNNKKMGITHKAKIRQKQ